jgi:uncharacterized membrane protein
VHTFIAILCDSEPRAYECLHALEQLHKDGTISLYERLVIERDAEGEISTKQTSERPLRRTGIGALLGALVGLFGGPAGVILGVAVGGLAGALDESVRWTLSDEYVANIGKSMGPNTFGVLAEVHEKTTGAIDARMVPLGAKVLRETRRHFVHDMIEKRRKWHREDVDNGRLERATDKAKSMELDLEADLYDARNRLKRTAEDARMQLDQTKADLDDKLATLEEQLARAKPDVRKDLEHRVQEIQRDLSERERKLSRALAIAEEALRR